MEAMKRVLYDFTKESEDVFLVVCNVGNSLVISIGPPQGLEIRITEAQARRLVESLHGARVELSVKRIIEER